MKRMHSAQVLLTALLLLGGRDLLKAETSPGGSVSARPRIAQSIDGTKLITLGGNVRPDLTPERDLGPVEDTVKLRLYLILQRSPEQQAELNNLLARQQQPNAPEYHKWLTPQQFGERFGVSVQDIAKIKTWLESQGFQVKGVLNNASMIEFSGAASDIKNTFHTQLRYWNVHNGKYIANAQNPSIPAALSGVVAGIKGLSKIPPSSKHTPVQSFAHDSKTNLWYKQDLNAVPGTNPKFTDGQGNYLLTPQDFYTIYHANPIYATGNLGAGATISIPEPTDMHFGTVNSSTGQASGGDVVTFRTTFGVAGTLNMKVMHGAGTVTCNDPGITDAEGEANLDAEWANAVAPSAQLIFMSCDTNDAIGDGFTTALTALIDNNISDVISSSYGNSEITLSASDFAMDDTLTSQAAAQGQSFIDAAGDAGSADADQNTTAAAVNGLNVDQYAGPPLVTAVGGTDFSDHYDADEGGPAQSTYWSSTNSKFYGDALSYIPETPWNGSCADSIIAKDFGNTTGASYCAAQGTAANGTLSGGGGGFSMHYSQPAFQAGTPGLSSSATKRAVPDIAFFAANGFWGHYLVVCDSSSASTACPTAGNSFGGAGGTSFTAPQTAGITALLITAAGERQGTLNPGLYALAKTQYTASATATACYSNGQTNNIGVTVGLPAAACIFHDVTTGNNDEPCQSGSLDCYVNPGAQYGMLSTTGASSLTVAYPAGPQYDEATGLGSLDIYNLITNWNQAYSSSTALKANPNSITSSESTTLTATVTPGTPAGFTGPTPAITGSVNFFDGTTSLGSCTLSGGTCSLQVKGSALQPGGNSVTATFTGSGTYPSSTSSIVNVNVSSTTVTPPTTPAELIVKSSGFCLDEQGSTVQAAPAVQNPCQGTPSQFWLPIKKSNGNYELQVQSTDWALDIRGASQQPLAIALQWPYYGGANQQWTLQPTSDGYFNVINVNSGMCLEIYNGVTTEGAGAKQGPCNETDSQKWSFFVPGTTSQTITFGSLPNVNYGVSPISLTATASSGLPVDYIATGPATVSGSTLTITGAGRVTVTAGQGGSNTYAPAPPVSQSFTVSFAGGPIPTTPAELMVKSSGYCLDEQGSTAEGAPAVQNPCTGSASQLWLPILLHLDPYELQVQSTGWALDIHGVSKSVGAIALQWPYYGGANQQWTITPTSDGYYTLTSVNSGLCLDIEGGTGAPAGAGVIQNTCNSTDSQKWSFVVPNSNSNAAAFSPLRISQ